MATHLTLPVRERSSSQSDLDTTSSSMSPPPSTPSSPHVTMAFQRVAKLALYQKRDSDIWQKHNLLEYESTQEPASLTNTVVSVNKGSGITPATDSELLIFQAYDILAKAGETKLALEEYAEAAEHFSNAAEEAMNSGKFKLANKWNEKAAEVEGMIPEDSCENDEVQH
eukprot:Selendium_serpulae@DN4852_c0_g1_i2.p1